MSRRRSCIALILGTVTMLACREGTRSASRPAIAADSLVIGVGADEFGLQLNRHRLGMYPLNASICEPPFRLDADMTVQPALATRAELRGASTFRLTLRRGVRFHDGTPFTVHAVRETIERSIRTRTQYSFLTDTSLRIVDDSTLELTPSLTNMRLVDQLAHPSYGVTAPGSDPTRSPVCTGPFRFVEYRPRSHLTVERHDGYWGTKAKLRRLTFRFIPDDNTRALALRAGEVDGVYDVNRGMVSGLRKLPGIRIVTSPPGSVMVMYIATRGTAPYTIMRDSLVRIAVAAAIDREALSESVLAGHASVVQTINPPVALGKHASVINGIPYNPEKAARMLDSAGWRRRADGTREKRGRALELTLISQASGVDRSVTEFIQAQLALVGVVVRVEQLEPGAFDARLNSGRFDLDIEVPNQNDGNPAFLLALRWYSRSNVRSARFMAAGPRFDSLVAASLSSANRDDAQRLAGEAMHELVDRQAAAIPLAGLFRIYALKEQIRGFEPHPSRASQWWNTVWIAQ